MTPPDPRTAEDRLRPPLDPATVAHDKAYMAGLIRGRELEREASAAEPVPLPEVDAAWEALTLELWRDEQVAVVARHRPTIEAAIRQSPSIDVERAAIIRALRYAIRDLDRGDLSASASEIRIALALATPPEPTP